MDADLALAPKPPIGSPATQGPPSSFAYEDLIAMANGQLPNMGDGRLPLPPMLMFDRIPKVDRDGGEYGKGRLEAELDIRPDLWFFACHFAGDPVMPGCLPAGFPGPVVHEAARACACRSREPAGTG